MTDGARIEATDVHYAYPDGDREALAGATLEVAASEVHAIMGGNGAGKTTLLRLIADLHDPDAGRIEIGEHAEAAPVVGYAPENPKNGFFAESVEKEVAFFPSNRGLDVDERVDAALDAMGIGHLRDRMPLSLSGGEQRMASIASVLAGDPAVLALDEPTTHLHRHGERELGAVLTDLDRTVVLSTHDADFAFEFADTVSILREGSVAAAGDPRDVLADLELLAGAGIRAPGIVEWAQRRGLDRVPSSIDAAADLEVD
ncbi:MAG: energy-coupling factor transporter ATP-binding protein EcfA2 [Halobacteriales archaeon]|jgi:energy-coupling factor transporter ATP-binding protein EcfA2